MRNSRDRATRSDSARLTTPGCAPVLGKLRRGKTNQTPFYYYSGFSGLRCGGVLKRVEKPDTDFIALILG